MRAKEFIIEGGNIFGDGAIPREAVRGIVTHVQKDLPKGIQAIPDIGSAGYKVESGDMDMFLDLAELAKLFGTTDEKTTKVALSQYLAEKGYKTKISGRNVHIEVPYKTAKGNRAAQVDLMVIKDAARVAPWHQHGPRGMYDDPGFKAGHMFILLNSIAKFLGLKVDAFGGTVMRRDNNEVVADNRDDAAKILLNTKATGADLNSVKTIMAALQNDPNREGKLAQAQQDVEKGLLKLDEVEELDHVSKSKRQGFGGPKDLETLKRRYGVKEKLNLGDFSIWQESSGRLSNYYIIDNRTQRAQIQLMCRDRNNVLDDLSLFAAPNNTVKAADFYRILITKLNKILVADRQSPGGQAVWAKLAKFPDVNVHGWLNGKPVNITPADREYAYGTEERGRWKMNSATGIQSWISNDTPENRAAKDMKLVAHKK